MKIQYDKKKYREKFVQEATFHVPLEMYLELSEKKRIEMFLRTEFILDHMKLVENYTCVARPSISEKRCLELARGVIAIADAFCEHMEMTKAAHDVDSEVSEELKDSIAESDDWSEFKKWRMIKAFGEEAELTEDYQDSQSNNTYTERAIIFDYIFESWRQAVLYNDENDLKGGKYWSVQDAIDARNMKAAWHKKQNGRMSAYLEYMQRDKTTMTGVNN